MDVKAKDLFEAFAQNELPRDQAYIVSSFINTKNGYAIYEIISYSGVKAIYPDGGGITFQSSGRKMHILVEPASYHHKPIEPYLRKKEDQIPLRFSELNLITTKNQIKIYLAKKPIESMSSFTVAKPVGFNISFVFYKGEGLYDTLGKFFEHTLTKDARVPHSDAKKVAKMISEIMGDHMELKSEFGS